MFSYDRDVKTSNPISRQHNDRFGGPEDPSLLPSAAATDPSLDALFQELADARLADEQLHRNGASFDELISSRDRLQAIRTALAHAQQPPSPPRE